MVVQFQFHECAAVAALRPRCYVKTVLRPTKKKMLPLSLPPPFPATALLKMLPILKTMPTMMMLTKTEKTTPDVPMKTMPDVPIPEDPNAETKTKPETDDTKTKKQQTMKTKMKHDDEDKEKKLEEVPSLKDPDHDTGVSPVDTPGDPRMDGNSLHLSSPTALPLQGPFPGD